MHLLILVTTIVSLATQQVSQFPQGIYQWSGIHFNFPFIAFIDPFFSSGVHLAFTGALAAAVSIASSIRGEYPEADVCQYHDAKIGVAYTRYPCNRLSLLHILTSLKIPCRCIERLQANAGAR